MCDFVLVSVDRGFEQEFVTKMGFFPKKLASNEWIKPFHEDDSSFLIISGLWCSCGLLSNLEELPPLDEEELDQIRRKTIAKLSKPKYRKQGWTPEKIARESEKVAHEASSKLAEYEFGLNMTFIAYLKKILKHVPRVSLYIFETPGSPGNIPPVQECQDLSINKLTANPSEIELYVLYDILDGKS